MSERGKKNVRNAKYNGVNGSPMNPAKGDDLESVEKLILSRALSHCKNSHGGYVLLCGAIRSGDTKSAKFLLQKGVKVDCKTDRTSLLHLAMRLIPVDSELIFLLLEKNATIDAPNGRKETPLHVAAEKGLVEVVRALLDKDANMTARTIEGSTPLLLAAENGHEEVVCMLFEHALVKVTDLKDTLSPDSLIEKRLKNLLLRIALVNGHKEFTQIFLESGFDLNAKDEKGKTCLHYLVDRLEIVTLQLDGRSNLYSKVESQKTLLNMRYFVNFKEEEDCVEMLRLLFANGAYITENPELLHTAVRKRSVEVCRVLIEKGADVNALDTNGNTPLYFAAGVEDWEKLEDKRKLTEPLCHQIMKLLFNSGADVSVWASHGLTALHRAAFSGRKKFVLFFLNHGVDVDLRAENDSTPLYSAVNGGFPEMVKFLLENGANVDACRKDGWTPLHLAASYENSLVVRILLDKGCDIDAKNIDGQTALDIAVSDVYIPSLGFTFDFMGTETSETFEEHISKLKVAGLHVSEHNLNEPRLFYEWDFSHFERKCEEEVYRMASKKLSSQFSLRDFLKMSENPSLARASFLLQTLKSFDFEEFPIYESLLKSKLEKIKFYLELKVLGPKSLDILVRASSKSNGRKTIVLPVELLDLLISFLTVRELRSLIRCGNALKWQQSH